jgi:hypothetical protein
MVILGAIILIEDAQEFLYIVTATLFELVYLNYP